MPERMTASDQRLVHPANRGSGECAHDEPPARASGITEAAAITTCALRIDMSHT